MAALLKDLQRTEEEKSKLDAQLEETRASANRLNDELNNIKVEIATAKEKIETSNTLTNSDKKNVRTARKGAGYRRKAVAGKIRASA